MGEKIQITISQPELNSNRLQQRLKLPSPLKKYINSNKFWFQYDAEIEDNPSINNIPLLSSILPLAWLTGADVKVDRIDSDYLQAVNRIQQDYKYMYPAGAFKTNILADSIEKNCNIAKLGKCLKYRT